MEPTATSGMISRYILLSDIVGASRLHEEYPREYRHALDKHNELIERTVDECGGEVFKNTGDGYYSFFESSHECIACAAKLARGFAEFPAFAENDPFHVRIVVHHGEMRSTGTEFFGSALNRASRLCQVCHPQQIILSEPAKLLQRDLPQGTTLTDLGKHHLRDLAKPEHLFQLNIKGLFQEFPALPTLGNRPTNLCEQPNTFIGRELELGELTQLLMGRASSLPIKKAGKMPAPPPGKTTARLVSIIAPGGYGKSRISAQLCANLLDSFERGVFFVELAPIREHIDIASALAGSICFQFYGSRDPKNQLIDFLREKEILLCFDNFEHVLEGAPFIADILKEAPGITIIVTSREPLRIAGEQVYKLQPLPIAEGQSDALMLFVDRALLVNPDFIFDVPLVQEICNLLSGIPLAIELAAAWMDSFSLSELCGDLNNQLELTARMSDLPERHRSLAASLDWSWSLLDEDHRTMLMAVSTFRGGCFADSASDVLKMKGIKLRSGLAKLTDKSWLYTREIDGITRFFFRDAVSREYAYKKLKETRGAPDSLYETSVVAHATHYSELMGREGEKLHGHGQLEALQSIGREKQNIYEAMDTLLNRIKREIENENKDGAAKGESPSTPCKPELLLLPITRWFWEFLDMTSDYLELVQRFQELMGGVEQGEGRQQVLLWALVGICRGQRNLGYYDAAHSNATRVKELSEAMGNRSGYAHSLFEIGTVESYQDNYDAARELYSQSCDSFSELGDRHGIAMVLNSLGIMEKFQGNYDSTRELYNESLSIKREIGDQHGIAMTINNLGVLEYTLGNYDAARRLYKESRDINHGIGNRRGSGAYLLNLGMVEYMQGNFDEALRLHTESQTFNREMGNRPGIAMSLNNMGFGEYRLGNFDSARVLYKESLKIFREIGDRIGISENIAVCGCLLATIHGSQPDLGWGGSKPTPMESGAICLFGGRFQVAGLGFTLEPLERGLIKDGLAIIEHPEIGLPQDERERLQAQAESMSLDELAEYALDALEKQ